MKRKIIDAVVESIENEFLPSFSSPSEGTRPGGSSSLDSSAESGLLKIMEQFNETNTKLRLDLLTNSWELKDRVKKMEDKFGKVIDDVRQTLARQMTLETFLTNHEKEVENLKNISKFQLDCLNGVFYIVSQLYARCFSEGLFPPEPLSIVPFQTHGNVEGNNNTNNNNSGNHHETPGASDGTRSWFPFGNHHNNPVQHPPPPPPPSSRASSSASSASFPEKEPSEDLSSMPNLHLQTSRPKVTGRRKINPIKNSEYLCHFCQRYFTTEGNYHRHMQTVPNYCAKKRRKQMGD